jgi:DNA-binding cell septation regulator SpoVG
MRPVATMWKPPQDSGSDHEFAISDWKRYTKNTLRRFLTITLSSGMVLHGCALHEKGDARWIGLPSQKFSNGDGTTGYTALVEFASTDARDRFNAASLRDDAWFHPSQGGW